MVATGASVGGAGEGVGAIIVKSLGGIESEVGDVWLRGCWRRLGMVRLWCSSLGLWRTMILGPMGWFVGRGQC